MNIEFHAVKVNQNFKEMLPIPNNNCVVAGNNTSVPSHVAAIMHNKRPIAPAMDKNQTYLNNNMHSMNNNTILQSGNKRKYNSYNSVPYPNQQTASVVRRNARERNRVKQVNNGFANLRQHIPPKVITQLTNGGRGANKKLSKVDTLKLAVEYIRSLQKLLDDSTGGGGGGHAMKSMEGYFSTNSPVSPTPSYISEASTSGTSAHNSFTRSQNNNSRFKMEPYDQYDQSNSSSPYSPQETSFTENPFANTAAAFKHESYEDFEPSINPEDEELLDTITWWQQQQ